LPVRSFADADNPRTGKSACATRPISHVGQAHTKAAEHFRNFASTPFSPLGFDLNFIDRVSTIKKPREKHEAHGAAPFLAKSAGCGGLGGCPDLRRLADHSGGTVADSHGLPHIPNLLNVETQFRSGGTRCQQWLSERLETPSAKTLCTISRRNVCRARKFSLRFSEFNTEDTEKSHRGH
jgi:hypothetical protein